MELKIQNITKRYRDKTAVDDVSITLTRVCGDCWGRMVQAKQP